MKINNIFKNTIFRSGIDERSYLKPFNFSISITILYIVFVSLYVWYSGRIALLLSKSAEDLAIIELTKGLLFVLITAIILFLFVYKALKKIEKQDNIIISQNKSIIATERLVMAGIFASSVCHDINNVMAIIVGNVDILLFSEKIDSSNRKSIEHISDASKNLIQLVSRMMDAGKDYIPGVKNLDDLSKVVEDTIEFARIHKKLKKCNFQFDIQPDLKLDINSILIGRTLMNLMLNAADATKETGNIMIRLVREDNFATIEVHDDGPGIDDENKEKIFEPFFTSKHDGNGLGLLSLKICAQQHNAKIVVKKSHLGGACFSLSLPTTINDK